MDLKSSITSRYNLGVKLAELYIACQEGVSQEISEVALNQVDQSDPWAVLGFNRTMGKSRYNVRV